MTSKAKKKITHLAMAHGSMKESEIMASRMPEPFEEPLPRLMSAARSIPVGLRVLDLTLFKMIAPTLLQSLSEGTKRNEGGVLLPNGHVVAHYG